MINAIKRVKYLINGGESEMIPRYIVVHHSKTKDSITVSWANIRHYHVHNNGWYDIGYHFGIELVGGHDGYEILVGRMQNEQGAHCRAKGMNKKSLGICFVGDYDESYVPDLMRRKGVILVKSLMEIWNIESVNVLGHRELAGDNRTCPGLKFDMDRFRKDVGHS